MRRILSIIFVLILCATPALGEGIPNANAVCDVSGLTRYAGFVLDESTGEWRVYAQETAALIDYLPEAVDELKEFGLCYISFGGNCGTGELWSELNVIYHRKSKAIGAVSAAIYVGDARYDAVLSPAESPAAEVEAYSARLGATGVELLQALAAAEEFRLEIVGKYVYEQAFALRDKERAQAYVGNFTLRGLRGAAAIANEIGAAAHDLWDGEETRLRRADAMDDKRLSRYLGKADRLRIKDKGDRVKAYQRLLRENGYYAGEIDGTFDGAVQRATLSAQQFAGLPETGCADAETILFLLDGALPGGAEPVREVAGIMADETCAIMLERYWIAPGFAASDAQDILAMRTRSDAGNMLLIVEGSIANRTAGEVYLPGIVHATIRAGGAEWPATVLAEADGGRALDSALNPLGEARLLMYAELPQGALIGDYALNLQLGSTAQVFALQN